MIRELRVPSSLHLDSEASCNFAKFVLRECSSSSTGMGARAGKPCRRRGCRNLGAHLLIVAMAAWMSSSTAKAQHAARLQPAEPVVRHMTAASGFVLSPMYPDSNYPDGVDVEWRFHLFPGDSFELDLDRFSPHGLSSTEGDEDHLRLVIDGREERDLDVSASTPPQPWFEKSAVFRETRVTLKFHSDASDNGVGFRANYRISCTNTTYCKNGGVCEPQRSYDFFKKAVVYGEPQCMCSEQFSGDHCEHFEPCFELACEPGSSTCHVDFDTGAVGCRCVKPGFMDLDGKCVDVDECSAGGGGGVRLATCAKNEVCVNTPGSYECVCADGFRKNDDSAGKECVPNSCPDSSWVWRESQCYWFDPEPRLLTFRAAVEECRNRSENSTLVWIRDAEENSFVGSNVVQPLVWLGIGNSDFPGKSDALDFWTSMMSASIEEEFYRPTARRRKRTVVPTPSNRSSKSVRKPRRWLSGAPVVFTNWGQDLNSAAGKNVTRSLESHAAVMVPSRWGQASCSEKKCFLCEAPSEYCPTFWHRNSAGTRCYYHSKYALDFPSAKETCEHLAIFGSLATIDSVQAFLDLSSWGLWSEATGASGSFAHYWFDFTKVSKAAAWMQYRTLKRPPLIRWAKGLTEAATTFSDSSYPLCAYMFPDQWTMSPAPILTQSKYSPEHPVRLTNPDFAGVVCKAPAAAPAVTAPPPTVAVQAAVIETAVDANEVTLALAAVSAVPSQQPRNKSAAELDPNLKDMYDSLLDAMDV